MFDFAFYRFHTTTQIAINLPFSLTIFLQM